jgi:ribosome-associated protein
MKRLNEMDLYKELTFRASRSSGPGGQNVNKSSTRVELRFNVFESSLLTEYEKQLVLSKLSNRINHEGILIIVSESERSQYRNKKKAIERLYKLIGHALVPDKKRYPSYPTELSKMKRLQQKHNLSEKKILRKPPLDE